MRWCRIVGLWLLLAAVSGLGLYWLIWWGWTPQQRAYARPAAEAEIGSWVSVDLPVLHVSWSPRVAAVLTDLGGRPRWYNLPAPAAAADLARLYPVPVSVLMFRVVLIAAVEAVTLQVVLLALARSMGRQRMHGIPPGERP